MFICEEDIRRKDRCYSVTENFFGIMKSELLNAKIQKGIRTGSQLLTHPTFWVHFMTCPLYLQRVHDRFLIIDDEVYHLGASLNELGKRLFAFSRLQMDKEIIMTSIISNQKLALA